MAKNGRRFLVAWFLFVLAGVLASMPSFAQAQQAADYITFRVGNDVLLVDPSKVEMQTVPVADGLYVVEAVGENFGGNQNIAVLVGNDGILLVDTLHAPLHQKIMDALRKISQQPIRFVINTNAHGDHTGGNELMAKAGAVIISHENERKGMIAESSGALPAPKEALPVVTYSHNITLHFNGEEIYVYHPQPAQTDGDSVVYFRHANVLAVGDLPSSIRYPSIGLSDGGSVDGMIAAAEQVLKLATPETKIITSRVGAIVSIKEVQEQHDMFVVVRDRVLSGIREGKTLQQIIASKPTAEFDSTRKVGFVNSDTFVKLVYQSLTKENP